MYKLYEHLGFLIKYDNEADLTTKNRTRYINYYNSKFYKEISDFTNYSWKFCNETIPHNNLQSDIIYSHYEFEKNYYSVEIKNLFPNTLKAKLGRLLNEINEYIYILRFANHNYNKNRLLMDFAVVNHHRSHHVWNKLDASEKKITFLLDAFENDLNKFISENLFKIEKKWVYFNYKDDLNTTAEDLEFDDYFEDDDKDIFVFEQTPMSEHYSENLELYKELENLKTKFNIYSGNFVNLYFTEDQSFIHNEIWNDLSNEYYSKSIENVEDLFEYIENLEEKGVETELERNCYDLAYIAYFEWFKNKEKQSLWNFFTNYSYKQHYKIDFKYNFFTNDFNLVELNNKKFKFFLKNFSWYYNYEEYFFYKFSPNFFKDKLNFKEFESKLLAMYEKSLPFYLTTEPMSYNLITDELKQVYLKLKFVEKDYGETLKNRSESLNPGNLLDLNVVEDLDDLLDEYEEKKQFTDHRYFDHEELHIPQLNEEFDYYNADFKEFFFPQFDLEDGRNNTFFFF